MTSGQKKKTGPQYILIYGLKLESSSMPISPDLSLERLAHPLTVKDLALSGDAGFQGWPALAPFVGECRCEIISKSKSNDNPDESALDPVQSLSGILHLRGFAAYLCVASGGYSWNKIAGCHDRNESAEENERERIALSPFTGELMDTYRHLILPRTSKTLVTGKDIRWIRDNFTTFQKLVAENEKYRFALDAVSDWRHLHDQRAAIARLWSGIEAVFGIKSELIYRISVLSAALLAPRGQKRINKFRTLKKLYTARSKAVHGEPMSEAALAKATNDSYQLLRRLLLYILAKGRPLTGDDFDQAVFG